MAEIPMIDNGALVDAMLRVKENDTIENQERFYEELFEATLLTPMRGDSLHLVEMKDGRLALPALTTSFQFERMEGSEELTARALTLAEIGALLRKQGEEAAGIVLDPRDANQFYSKQFLWVACR